MVKLKIYKLASIALVLGIMGACKPIPATLTGEIKDYRGGMTECMIKTDTDVIEDSLQMNADGTFSYTRDFPEGAEIWLTSEDAQGFVRLYLKNGDKQHVILTASADSIYGRCDVTFNGDTKSSEYLWAFDHEFGSLTKWTVGEAGKYQSFKEYKAAIDATADQLRTQLEATKDKKFIAYEQKKLEKKQLAIPFRFAWAKMSNNEPTDMDMDFVEYIESLDYNTMESAKAGLINMYIKWYLSCHTDSVMTPGEQFFIVLKDKVSDQAIIDYVADSYMATYMENGADAYLESTFEAYKNTTTHQDKVEELQSLYDKIIKILPGTTASDFALQDVNDKPLKFSDVIGKGKVVYLDVWATWCGPCCAEIPHVEALVKHYAGNPNIEFVSVSLDDNVAKWKNKLKADKPEWRQFITTDGMKSDLCKEYQINGIPRFMLFDKAGKIITTNAPRASDSEIQNYLDNAIK